VDVDYNSDVLDVTVEHNAVGYALIANFQSSDRDFLQYRGFFQLHSRVLSALQADIGYLETELDSMDEWDINCGIERRLACLREEARRSPVTHGSDARRVYGHVRPYKTGCHVGLAD